LEVSRRDKWFNSDEAKEFGLIDEVIKSEGTKTISEMLVGFDDYYNKEVFNR
jgi:hypothetical protein